MLHKPSAANQLASSLEEFVSAAEAFLQSHYQLGSDSEDIQKILKAITNLHLDVDTQELEREFELNQEKKTF